MKNNEIKIYALILESESASFLSIQMATSLEEAFMLAKLEFEKITPTKNNIPHPILSGAKIGLFTIKTVDEMALDLRSFRTQSSPIHSNEEKTKVELPPEFGRMEKDRITSKKNPEAWVSAKKEEFIKEVNEEVQKRNLLIREIIQSKDIKAYKKNFKKLTPAERKYVREHLK